MHPHTPTANEGTRLIVSFRTVLAGAIFTLATIGLLGWNGWGAFQHFDGAVENQKQFEEQVALIAHADEMMTMSARLCASTGESDWAQRYEAMVNQRDAAISEAIRHVPVAFAQTFMQTYETAAGRLERDRRALLLVADGQRALAEKQVFSADYEQYLQKYRGCVMHTQMKLREAMEQTVAAARLRAYLVGTFTAVTLLVVIMGWLGAMRLIRRQNADRLRAADALRLVNDQLEHRVAERTANLEETNERLKQEIARRYEAQAQREHIHQQLVESSHKLGMAEVATNVLHNVGNVLNSVNISAGVIRQNLEQSGCADVARVARLIEEHQDDLALFITQDARGRYLPQFLVELAAQIERERSTVGHEIETLMRNIEHIKTIVTMQQTHARHQATPEPIRLAGLVQDALTMTSAALERNGIAVEQNIDSDLELSIDRHRVLQILINFISNAKRALMESEVTPRVMRIAVYQNPTTSPRARKLVIEVSDNGVGIAPENLTRIFAHGFTTRADGHGFGLHSCALAAKEMRGQITAESAGLGRGATFRLELPIVRPEGSRQVAQSQKVEAAA